MTNLKEETIDKLHRCGKETSDIVWIGCKDFKIPADLFWKLADKSYDAGYGAPEVATDLIIVGDNWWLERSEYDGSEWWEFKTIPMEPAKTVEIRKVLGGIWDSLMELNEG